MTLIELLKKNFNATEEQATSFLEAMKAEKIYTASEENLDIRYGKLKTQHETQSQQYQEAQNLIATMKAATKDQEDLQKKAAESDAKIAALSAALQQAQIDGEVNVALLAAGVKPDDIDYVTFKLKAKGELELDDNGKIKGMDDKIAALKTQLPAQFSGESKKIVLENKLPTGDNSEKTVTKEDFNKMGYNARVALKQENPELYNQMTKG